MKKALIIFATILAIFGGTRLYFHLTDDFRLGNITFAPGEESIWIVPQSYSQDFQTASLILNQPFYYLGKGAQCYAFISEDQKYILKFFKFKHLRPSLFISLLPPLQPFSKYKKREVEHKREKIQKMFTSYDLAFRENKEIAKLIYLHLTPTNDLHQSVILFDKMGLKRTVSLDQVPFVLQKRGETLRSYFSKKLDQGQIEEVKESLSKLISMYLFEYERELYDHDHGVMQNLGFIENEPFHLDVGKLMKNEKMKRLDIYKQDLAMVFWKIAAWMKSHYPEYFPSIIEYLAQQYNQMTGEKIDMINYDRDIYRKARRGWPETRDEIDIPLS